MITSNSNNKIKYVARLQADRRFRWQERAFVVEGLRGVRDVIAYQRPTLILHTLAVMPPPLAVPTLAISEPLMRHVSDVETPSGILAVVPFPDLALPAAPTLLLILDGVQTPGNMGTMLRTAAAAGADGVIVASGCVDPFNPKVVRGGMGAHFRLPLQKMGWNQIERAVAGMGVWVASADSPTIYTTVNWQQRAALIIGNEANGPSAQALRLATGVAIPMAAAVESLNAAMAAGIILFEAARQRNANGER
jgi:TrmH family RNA methyltransferase